MATFAEYPAHMMASNDFTLYPEPESWTQEQSYLPTASYAERAYLNATAFEHFQSHPSFASYSQFDYEQQAAQTKSQYCSPAQSASHSIDHTNPPHFSTTSDSGHSTISSAMASPSAQAQHGEWNSSMNLFPDIVRQHDDTVFTTGYDYETMTVTDKGCVGE